METISVSHRTSSPTMTVADAEAIFDTYAKCVLSGDLEGWIDLWADEPVVKLQPNTPTLFGKDAIVGALRADLEAVAWQTMDIAIGEVIGDGDLAFARGTFTLAGQTRDVGQQLSFDGKFLTVFRRQPDGSWRIIRDVYNFDS